MSPLPYQLGALPRCLIAKILNFHHSQSLKGELYFSGTPVAIYRNFLADDQKRHTSYAEVKECLWDKSLQYAMLYPVNLWVITADRTTFFASLKEKKPWPGWPQPSKQTLMKDQMITLLLSSFFLLLC